MAQQIKNYIHLFRWHQPIGIWLLLWPVLIALTVASNGSPPLYLIVLFTLGCVFSRSAGCAINDYLDQSIDPHVERTSNRPLATGAITGKNALWAFASCLVICAVIAALIGPAVLAVAIIAAAGLMLYPLAKRYFRHPQLVLGIVYGLGVPMAWIAGSESVTDLGWIELFVANLCWIYAYDTIYAMADKPYDGQLAIHSSALTLSQYDWLGVASAQGLTVIFLLLWIVQQSLGAILLLGLTVVVIGFIWQLFYIRQRTIDRCLTAFRSNHWLQCILFISILIDYHAS